MQNSQITDGDPLSNKVKINLDVLGALMLDWVGGHVDCTDVVAIYQCSAAKRGVKLQEELEKARAELAEAKKAAAAEAESARAAAVQEFLGSKEHERRLVEEALKGYERGLEDMKRVAVGLRPDIDPARLFVPPGGFQ